MAVYPNPFVLNIIDLQNVITNSGGVDTQATLQSNIAALQSMVDTTNHIVYTDTLRDFSGTGQIQIEADLNLATNYRTGSNVSLFSNGNAVEIGGGGSITSGTTSASVGSNTSTFQVQVASTVVLNVDSVGNTTAAGAMYATGFYTLSDMGVKGNIREIGGGVLDRVCGLRPARWTWDGSVGGGEGVGLIAQDVERMFPELVHGTDGEKRVDLVGLLGYLVGAIKEIKSRGV
jgi:hypothetical protein